MSAAPLVSVVVPVHDDAEGMRRCLAALRAQNLEPSSFEVLVCDNASTHSPVTAADVEAPEHHERSGPAVSLLSCDEPGSYRARNQCLPRARGRVLAFTDADCTPHPTWLSEGLAALERTGSDLVAGRVAVYPEHQPPRPVELYEMESAFPQEKYVATMSFGVTANLFVDRSVFDAVGPFDEELLSGGDREFCERAARAGHGIDYTGEAVVDHPARASVPELWTKATRVMGGARTDGRLRPAGQWLAGVRPPLGAAGRARRSTRLTTRRDRGGYVLGELTAHYVRWVAEGVARLGPRSSRRG